MRLRVLRMFVLMLFVVLGVGCQSGGGQTGGSVGARLKSQVFMERVPAGSLLYVGWAGAKDVRGYEGSHLEGMVESSNVKEVISKMLPAAFDRLAIEKPEIGMFKPTVEMVAKILWEQKFAFVVTGVDMRKGPSAAFLVEGSEDVKSLKNILNLMTMALPQQIKQQLKMTYENEELLITFGKFDEKTLAVLKGEAVGGVGNMRGLVRDPVQVLYLNVGGIHENFKEMISSRMGATERKMMYDMLGVDKMGSVTASMGFEGGDWASQGYVEVKRGAGVFGLMSQPLAAESLLKNVPASAEVASGFTFDFVKLIEMVEVVVDGLPGRAKQEYVGGKAMVDAMLGVDLKDDLFAALGKSWVVYLDKNVGGTGPLGFVAVNDLKDAVGFEKNFLKMMTSVKGIVNQQLREVPVKIVIKAGAYDGIKVHYLGTPLVSPAWAVYEGQLFVGLFPQEVVGAIAYVRDGGKSLANHRGFKDAINSDEGLVSFTWFDLPRAAEKHYSGSVMLGRTLMGAGDLFGVTSPDFVVPPLYEVKKHLKPISGFVRVDDEGISFSSLEAFPGSSVFGTDINPQIFQQQALMAGLLMPALSGARGAAQTVQDMNNMKQLVLMMHTYGVDHDDQFPQDRVSMYKLLNNTNVFFSVTDRNAKLHYFGNTDAELEAFLSGSSIEIVWHGGKISDYKDPRNEIVVYKKLADGKVAVGMLQGHIEVLPRHRFDRLIKQQQKLQKVDGGKRYYLLDAND